MSTWRISYGGLSGTFPIDDSLRQWSALNCSGSETAGITGHSLGPGSIGQVVTGPIATGTSALQYTIATRSGSGSANIRIDWSANNTFTDAVVLMDTNLLFGAGAGASITCLPLTSAGPTTPCVYGTQVKPGVAAALTLLPDFISAVATTRGMGWIAARFAALYYTVLNVEDLCSRLPPVPSDILPNDFSGNFGKMIEALGALLWPELCECIPGSPTPTPPVVWVDNLPPGSATTPTFPVSTPGDPAALSAILSRLSEIQAALAQDLELDTLMQRWQLPFATVEGSTETDLADEGQFGVDRILGLLITVTQLPEGVTTWPGNPIYIKDLGWIAVDDGGAMLQELRITRQQQWWFPTKMQLATRVSWALTPDTRIAVQMFRPEP